MAVEIGNKISIADQAAAVGLRSLPNLDVKYYARTPKPNPFRTVWLPINASNRIIMDKKQDLLHLYYSRHLHEDRIPPPSAPPQTTRLKLNRDFRIPSVHYEENTEFVMPPKTKHTPPDSVKAAMWMTSSNSVAPFASLGKPTCGYFFTRTTDNKKRLTGIPPTNTVKWRSNTAGA